MIAIDGRSGAGKSSLAARLRSELNAPVVALEDRLRERTPERADLVMP